MKFYNAIDRYLMENRMSAQALAHRIGVASKTVNEIRRGKQLVGIEVAVLLSRETGIPMAKLPLTKIARAGVKLAQEQALEAAA